MLVVKPKWLVLWSLASEPGALWCSFHSSTGVHHWPRLSGLGLKRIRRTPKVRCARQRAQASRGGAPWGWNAFLGCILLNFSIHPSHWLPEPGFPVPPKIQHHAQMQPMLLCSSGSCVHLGPKGHSVSKYHTKPWTYNHFLLLQFWRVTIHRGKHQNVLELEEHLRFHRPWEEKGLRVI